MSDIVKLNVSDSVSDQSIINRNVQFVRVFYVIDGYSILINIWNWQYILLKLTVTKYPAKHTNYIIPHCTTWPYNHNIRHGTWAERKSCTRKIMNSTVLPFFHFGMNSQCFAEARLTWPPYDEGTKRENSSVWKERVIVASTRRRSVEFGCYVTLRWMANFVSVMTKMLPLYNVTITFHGRRAWKTSQSAHASGGSRFWLLLESILFGHHVSLRLHW